MATQSTLTHIGSYPLLSQLGAGGMGTVYLALHRGVGGFEKKVAIKCINPHVAGDKQFITMLVDEAKLTAQLTHPNIVQVMDLAHSNGLHYLVMEYVEGVDASTLSKSFELSLDEAVYLVAEAARGLAYAHRKCGPEGEPLGIVHRDISGHNLLVSCEGITKVLDFGIAKAASNRSSTQIGVLKGKLAYMSPEQASGKKLDARSDLFSLGIVLWELCTRQRLFHGDTDIALLMQVQKCEVEAPSRLVDGFPRDLESIILRCLAPTPEHRYADGDRLADDLHEFLRSHQGAMPPRAKLAQKVSACLRQNPPKAIQTETIDAIRGAAIEKTEMVGGSSDATLVASRNGATRAVSSPKAGAPPSRRGRKIAWVAVPVFVVLAAAGGFFGARLTNPNQSSPLVTLRPVAETPVKQPAEQVQAAPPPAATQPQATPQPDGEPAQPSTPVVDLPPDSQPQAPKAAPVASAPPTPGPKVTREKNVAAVTPHPKVSEPPAAQEQQSGTSGFLSINTLPWARVYIDGKSVAESTPLLKYSLPSGVHKIVLVNPELRIRKEIEVTIGIGEHVRQSVKLE